MTDAHDRLRALLRADPPPGVAGLDDAGLEALASLVERARERQSRTLTESFEATLKHVPFPARKIVKKVLLG